MEPLRSAAPPTPARLNLLDTVSIIVGIIVGVGIFKAPAEVFQNVGGPWQVLGVWTLGGVLSLLGALCFAELASTYTRSGGEYVYLGRAFGPAVGFLFAWAQLALLRSGAGIAMLAFVLMETTTDLWGLGPDQALGFAVVAVLGLTAVNLLGANPGRLTQNLLTFAKVASLAGIVVAGLFLTPAEVPAAVAVAAGGQVSLAVAMMGVLYAYQGWNEAAYVSQEVRRPQRNLPLALIFGTGLVTVIYLLVNVAYLVGLGYDQARAGAGAADLLVPAFGPAAGRVVQVLIIVTVLGGLNGMIFTGSRIYSEMGADHRLFAWLGRWSPRFGTPVWSLLIQAGLSVGMMLAVSLAWKGRDEFMVLLKITSPVFWIFFLLTGLSLFVLRYRDPDLHRPFRVPFYPAVPALFCLLCALMVVASFLEVPPEALIGLGVLALGLPFYAFSNWLSRRAPDVPLAGPHGPTLQRHRLGPTASAEPILD